MKKVKNSKIQNMKEKKSNSAKLKNFNCDKTEKFKQ